MSATRAKGIAAAAAVSAAVILPAFVFADHRGGFLFFNSDFVIAKLALSLLLPFCAALIYFFKIKNPEPLSFAMLIIQPAFVLCTIVFKNYYIRYSIDYMHYHYAYGVTAFFAVLLAAVLAAQCKKLSGARLMGFCRRFFAGYLFVFVYLFAQLYVLQRIGLTGGIVNFIPFSGEIRRTVQAFPNPWLLIRTAGNVLFYSSFALMLGCLFPKIKSGAGQALLLIGCPIFTALACELVQYLTHCGNADVDDIMLNAAGAVIGFFAFKYLKKLFGEN